MCAEIPAVCTNPKCRTVFFSTSGFAIPEGGSSTLQKCKQGPCPRCGSLGLIPSGTYQNVAAKTLFFPRSEADKNMLENGLRLVREAVAKNMSLEAFREAAAKRSPELAPLWDLMPTSRQEAYQFWLTVIALVSAILLAIQTTRSASPQHLLVPPELLRAIQSAVQPNNRDDSHTAPPEEPPHRSQRSKDPDPTSEQPY
jgi:hypothetical protein